MHEVDVTCSSPLYSGEVTAPTESGFAAAASKDQKVATGVLEKVTRGLKGWGGEGNKGQWGTG